MPDSPCNTEIINRTFFALPEYIDPVIRQWELDNPNIWTAFTPKGVFAYGQGLTKHIRQFHQGRTPDQCAATWAQVQVGRDPGTNGPNDPGYDPCRREDEIVGYGGSEREFTLYRSGLRTSDICIRDWLYAAWNYEDTLRRMFNMLAGITVNHWEIWHREQYLMHCLRYILIRDNTTRLGFQAVNWNLGACTIPIPAGGFNAIGRLNQEVLDYIYAWLSRQTRAGAVGMRDGIPIFPLVTSPEESTAVIRGGVATGMGGPMRQMDMWFAQPGFAIEGVGTVGTYQGYAHVKDLLMPRLTVDATGTNLVRVEPYQSEAASSFGNMITVDRAYIDAPFQVSVIRIKDVWRDLRPPMVPSSLAGMSFGQMPNNGTWKWKNFIERCENPEGEKGFFRAEFESAPEPLDYAGWAVALIHRRCVDIPIEPCEDACTCDAVNVLACAQDNADDELAEATQYRVTLDECVGCGPGEEVTVVFLDASTQVAIVVNAIDSPTIVIAFSAGLAGGWCAKGGGMATLQCSNCGADRGGQE